MPMLLSAATRKPPLGSLLILFLALSSVGYFLAQQHYCPPRVLLAKAQEGEAPAFDFEETSSDLEVDWGKGGDFDPHDKCPPDFFSNGFVLVCKKVADGAYFKFLFHEGKRLLYRIDKNVIGGKASIGLHWVESTRYNAGLCKKSHPETL